MVTEEEAGKTGEWQEEWGCDGRGGGVTEGIGVRQVGWGCHKMAGGKTGPTWEW